MPDIPASQLQESQLIGNILHDAEEEPAAVPNHAKIAMQQLRPSSAPPSVQIHEGQVSLKCVLFFHRVVTLI
jgi:hypothetical protein